MRLWRRQSHQRNDVNVAAINRLETHHWAAGDRDRRASTVYANAFRLGTCNPMHVSAKMVFLETPNMFHDNRYIGGIENARRSETIDHFLNHAIPCGGLEIEKDQLGENEVDETHEMVSWGVCDGANGLWMDRDLVFAAAAN
jgi:hypothetical protein